MKIFKWSIHPTKRIEKIHQLIGGSIDDQKIAQELLIPSENKEEDETYPQYRILVRVDELRLEKLDFKEDGWKLLEREFYSNISIKENKLARLTQLANSHKQRDEEAKERAKFKEYTIKL